MASAPSSATPVVKGGVAPLRAGQGTSFWLRRLHSLSGIVPVGLFLIEHFVSNAFATRGQGRLHQASRVPEQLSFCRLSGIVWHLAADSLSLAVRLLHLVPRRKQCRRLSVGGQLDVHGAALDGRRRLLLYGVAHLALAFQRHALAEPPYLAFGKVQNELS